MKNIRLKGYFMHPQFIQTTKIMKIYVLLALISISHVFASSLSSQNISLNVTELTVREVFQEIEKQSQYSFFYNNRFSDLDKKLNFVDENTTIDGAMRTILANTNLSYRIIDESLVVIAPDLIQDQLVITGQVTSSNDGTTIPGVSVVVEGTTIGTSTNASGLYSISVPREAESLTFSFLGYKPQTVSIRGRNVINISLEVDMRFLDEVLVVSTGYQTIARERATGSFNVVDPEQIDKPTINVASRLIGTTAGMQARLDVDGNPTFEIRGQTSLFASAAPLVVVDGFAIEGDFNSINPNDVESVTILKDAAAASIWGARAANGVIVVTTKKARKDTPIRVEFSYFTRVGQKFDLDYVRPHASSAETVDFEILASDKWQALAPVDGSLTYWGRQFSEASMAIVENRLGHLSEGDLQTTLNRLRGLDNKQQISDLLLANPVNNQYNLSLYGSTGRINNTVSFLFEQNQSNFQETYNKRMAVNYRANANIFNWLDFNFSTMLQQNKFTNSGVSLGDIQDMAPYEMLLNEDGTYTNVTRFYYPIIERLVPTENFPYPNWYHNPVQEIRNRDLTSNQLNARIQAGLTFTLIRGLNFDSRVQYENFNTYDRNLYNDETFYVRDITNKASAWDQSTNEVTANLPMGSILTQSRTGVEAYTFRNQLNLNRSFNRHEINAVAGTEFISRVLQRYNNPTSYGYNDNTLTVGTFPNGPGGTFSPIRNWQGANQTFAYTNSFAYLTDRFFSLYGNVAYTFDGKYTLSGSARTDASNFISDDPKYRYAPFWSVGMGWQMHKESFLQGISWLNRLNMRLTFGHNGNVDRTTAFMPLISVGSSPNVYTNEYIASISSYGNPTLRWEKTGTLNLGFDYSVLGGKLFGKIDIYNKSGKDLIATLSIPAVSGTASQKLNNAEMINRGIELEFGTWQNLLGDQIVWRGNLNFSYNHNKITKLFVANYIASSLYGGGTASYVEGENASSHWRFEYAGVYDGQPMIYGAGDDMYNFAGWTPGDGRDFMLNMGTRVAPFTLGTSHSFQINDFNLSFIITGKFGHVFDRTGFNYPVLWTSRLLPNNKLSEVVNGDMMQIVPLPQNENEPRYFFWSRFYPYLSYLTENASHIRMQEVNLTYNLPASIMGRLNLNSRPQIFVQGNDLFTILFNDAGEDPEYPVGGMKPQPKFTFGVKLNF